MNDNKLFLKKVKDKCFWAAVRNDDKYQFFIDELKRDYKKYCSVAIEELPFSSFNRFFIDGNRSEYEELYFERRRRLNTYALLSMIYPENEEYISRLQDIIWAICNEYSWVLPAHMGFSEEIAIYDENNIKNGHNTIDLFAAETGYALSEIKFILGERLDKWVKERISKEIDRRIITVYYNSKYYYWEGLVEIGPQFVREVLVALLYMNALTYSPKIKDRIHKAMQVFLSSYKENGVCEEGVMYWEYGFGFFVAYAQTLYEITEGKENLFALERVKKIAEYSKLIFLNDGLPVTFGDTTLDKKPISFGLMGQLKSFYNDLIPTFNFCNYHTNDACGRWQSYIRSIVFFDTENEYEVSEKNDTVLKKDVGLFIKRSNKYDAAVTAGNNDAPHNHNDLGSFIIRYGKTRIFDDFGAGEYTKSYFDDEIRYNYFVCGAQGHSVPVIDGKFQCLGGQYRGEMELKDNVLSVDLTKGYECEHLKGFTREFKFLEDEIILSDCFEFQGEVGIRERFVTKVKPEIIEDTVKLSDAVLKYNTLEWEMNILTETFSDHDCETVTAYVIEFVPKNYATNFEMSIELL